MKVDLGWAFLNGVGWDVLVEIDGSQDEVNLGHLFLKHETL